MVFDGVRNRSVRWCSMFGFGDGVRWCSMLEVIDEVESMDLGACNDVIGELSRNELVDEALALFRRMKDQDMDLNVVSWTSMIACCSQNGKDMEAFEIFREMQLAGVMPNAVTT
ncbi:hypothetical protein Droror1_Dr00002415 [Drosera rotundifolia]